MPAGLQPAPFGHSGNPPVSRSNLAGLNDCSPCLRAERVRGDPTRSREPEHDGVAKGAGERNRTPNRRFTKPVLCRVELRQRTNPGAVPPVSAARQTAARWCEVVGSRSFHIGQIDGCPQVPRGAAGRREGRREMRTPHPRPRWLAARASNRGLAGGARNDGRAVLASVPELVKHVPYRSTHGASLRQETRVPAAPASPLAILRRERRVEPPRRHPRVTAVGPESDVATGSEVGRSRNRARTATALA